MSGRLTKAVNAHYKPFEDRLRDAQREKKALKDADLARVQPRAALLNSAILSYRRAERERIKEEARQAAEAERKRVLQAQERAAKKIERQAAKARGQDKKDLTAAASATRDAPVEEVDTAVEREVAQRTADWTGAGRGSTRAHWSARVDDFRKLVDAVARGEADIDCLLPNQPFLNGQARLKKRADLALPGVVGVSDERLARN